MFTKQKLLVPLLLLFIILPANAQRKKYRNFRRPSDYKNVFYLKAGYSLPTWGSYGMDRSQWKEKESSAGANYQRLGGDVQLGSQFYINRHLVRNNTCFGINLDYVSLTHNYYKIDAEDFYEWKNHTYLSTNVGPMLTYTRHGINFYDLYAKANITWISLLQDTELEQNGKEITNLYIDDFSMRYSVGFNFRFSHLLIGIEYCGGSHKLLLQDTFDDYYGSEYDFEKTPLHFINAHLGVYF